MAAPMSVALAKVAPRERPRMEAALGRFRKFLAAEGENLQAVRYLTGRRRALVFELRSAAENGRTASWFLKFGVSLDEGCVAYVNTEARNTLHVHRQMSESPDFLTSELAVQYEDLACFVLRSAPGRRLDRLVAEAARPGQPLSAAGEARRYCMLAGRWLAYFQEKVDPERREPMTPERFLARVEREVVVVNEAAPPVLSEAECRMIRARAEELIRGFQPRDFRSSARHSDFAPWNVLCHEGRVCVIDYADLAQGSCYFDAWQFIDAMQVLGNRVLTRRSRVDLLKEAFARECGLVDEGSPAVAGYFSLLCKLIRMNAVLNNSRWAFPYSIRNRRLLDRYAAELRALVPAPAGGGTGAGAGLLSR